MVICCVCGTEMTEEKNIPDEEWSKMSQLLHNESSKLTEIQNIALFEGYVCKECYYKG